jgi:hypothetical protein
MVIVHVMSQYHLMNRGMQQEHSHPYHQCGRAPHSCMLHPPQGAMLSATKLSHLTPMLHAVSTYRWAIAARHSPA